MRTNLWQIAGTHKRYAFQYLKRVSWVFFYRLESFVSYFFCFMRTCQEIRVYKISCYCPCGCCWNNLASFFCFMRNVKKFMCIGFHATAHVGLLAVETTNPICALHDEWLICFYDLNDSPSLSLSLDSVFV